MGLPFECNLNLTRKYKKGPSNQITDVEGISVGHVTIEHPADNIYTGVTAILPHQGNLSSVLCGMQKPQPALATIMLKV